MEIASLILSVIALGFSLAVFIRFEAKERSTHQVQLVPADTFVESTKTKVQDNPLMDFDDPRGLDLDEKKYFESLDKKI